MTGKIWFVGAGPGDPDLMTVKARKLLEQSGAVLFAGSLVDQAATLYAPAGCEIRDSKDMTLDEMTDWLIAQARQHQTVVRLQTGDPGLYGALIEMTRPLTAAGIEWAVVPGVSSAMASMAAAGETLTLPEVTQTVILTRVAGRTPMPPGEELEALAAHKTHVVHLPVDHPAAQGAGSAARCRLVGRLADSGGAESQLAGRGKDRARHHQGHQAQVSGREDRQPGHDRRQPDAGRGRLAGPDPLQALRPDIHPPLSQGYRETK
jgi:siroheme synthase